jgi:hypothetical protein
MIIDIIEINYIKKLAISTTEKILYICDLYN